jgi:hypothetical protein
LAADIPVVEKARQDLLQRAGGTELRARTRGHIGGVCCSIFFNILKANHFFFLQGRKPAV